MYAAILELRRETAAKSTAALSTSEATHILGGVADTWGHAWAVNDFSNTNFRLRIINVASSTARDFSLDWVAVRATYQVKEGNVINTI